MWTESIERTVDSRERWWWWWCGENLRLVTISPLWWHRCIGIIPSTFFSLYVFLLAPQPVCTHQFLFLPSIHLSNPPHPLRSDPSTFSPPWDRHSSRFTLFNLPKFSFSPWFSPRAPIYRLVMFSTSLRLSSVLYICMLEKSANRLSHHLIWSHWW